MTTTIPDARKDEIRFLAEAVADEYSPGIRVEPERIAERSGLTFTHGHYGDAFDGLLEHADGCFHIYCNLDRLESPTAGRTRFTLGHELGHYFIDEHRNALSSGTPPHQSITDFRSPNPVEREADLFAANLILPESRFSPLASAAEGLSGILGLADRFGASATSTALRYVQTDVRPCALLKWTPEGELDWPWMSSSFYAAVRRRITATSSSLPADSATAKALSADLDQGQVGSNGSTVSAWCAGIQPGSRDNFILREEAFRLGRHGAITLLQPEIT